MAQAYSRHVWSSNELITEAKLNHIEEGIANADSKATEQIASIIENKDFINEKVGEMITNLGFSVNAENQTLNIGITGT